MPARRLNYRFTLRAAAARPVLGSDLAAGQAPQPVVPAGCWQSAVSRGVWTLVGCTVAATFDFATFERAPAGWAPDGDRV